MMRPSWDETFMDLAHRLARRSTCDRAHVGAVIVSPAYEILSTGYNGSVREEDHCDDVGHLMIDGHCVRTIHAEQNAVLQIGRPRCIGTTIYISHYPCLHCAQTIVQAGIAEVVYDIAYRIDPFAAQLLERRTRLRHFLYSSCA